MPSTLFSLTNPDLTQDRTCHFRIGLPFPQGELPATADVCLQDNASQLTDVGYEVTQLWEDGSVKWLSVFGLHQIKAGDTREIAASESTVPLSTQPVPISLKDELVSITLNNGETIAFSRRKFWHLSTQDLYVKFCINESSDLPHHHLKTTYKTYQYNGVFTAVVIEQSASVEVEGKALELRHKSTIFLSDGTTKSEFTFCNPSAALHPSGQWDLGDPNSLNISEIGLHVNNVASLLHVDAVDANGQAVNTEIADFTSCSLIQFASGEENYDCPNHVDALGKVPDVFNGYQIIKNGTVAASGKQCSPTAIFSNVASGKSLFFNVDKFWQKFPSSLRIQKQNSAISLLGSAVAPRIELQPGEQGSRSVFMSESNAIEADVTLNAQALKASHTMPFAPWSESNNAFKKMIDAGIEGDNSFFNKRLIIDEFGWRHFGELYADHEKALQPDIEHFISHYNNQYDPIQGMLYQWVISGDRRWFKLADDLAKHVCDIDIYHTQKDKPEYSGGLFWHTDHYVQAYRATHRTYSAHQPSDVYDDHAGGGGPGGQHCYTTGLLLHYLLTGYPPSREAVLSQSNWISHYYEGDNTLFSALLAIKNAGTEGLKNVKTGKYPLDRGTGNYINALLDTFELTGSSAIIQQCGHIISNTVSPDDDLKARNFDNVEATWFYTVFLQAVCKFISVKERQTDYDNDYHWALASLLHYAKWMAEHEYAYLDKPEILEFPNQTWSGQDIRKLCVLNFARAYLPPDWVEVFDKKIHALEQTIVERISTSDEATTTRLLCLMMQNVNYATYRDVPKPGVNVGVTTQRLNKHPVISLLIHRLSAFSLRRERLQLAKRFPQLQKWLGKP